MIRTYAIIFSYDPVWLYWRWGRCRCGISGAGYSSLLAAEQDFAQHLIGHTDNA